MVAVAMLNVGSGVEATVVVVAPAAAGCVVVAIMVRRTGGRSRRNEASGD